MKVRMTFKTPDVIQNALEGEGMDEPDANHRAEILQAYSVCNRFVANGEYLTVEVDTEKETCVVVPV